MCVCVCVLLTHPYNFFLQSMHAHVNLVVYMQCQVVYMYIVLGIVYKYTGSVHVVPSSVHGYM